MVSVKKKHKLKNAYCGPSTLKHKEKGPKRIVFYTSSLRQLIKKIRKDEWQG